jgi:hypothetical protein
MWFFCSDSMEGSGLLRGVCLSCLHTFTNGESLQPAENSVLAAKNWCPRSPNALKIIAKNRLDHRVADLEGAKWLGNLRGEE